MDRAEDVVDRGVGSQREDLWEAGGADPFRLEADQDLENCGVLLTETNSFGEVRRVTRL